MPEQNLMKEYLKKDSNLPTLTVVTPAYNQADFLRDTIESVLSQDYPNIEYVVLDDGSTDETPQILKEYGDKFVWESQKNMGQTPTINKGWAMTSGEQYGAVAGSTVRKLAPKDDLSAADLMLLGDYDAVIQGFGD